MKKARKAPITVPAEPKYELYLGEELKRNPGLTEERFTAFSLPSRMGNRLVYPRRPA